MLFEISQQCCNCFKLLTTTLTLSVFSRLQGVMEMKESFGIDSSLDHQLSYFLDRYYMSRISIRMLINQHGIIGWLSASLTLCYSSVVWTPFEGREGHHWVH